MNNTKHCVKINNLEKEIMNLLHENFRMKSLIIAQLGKEKLDKLLEDL